MSLGWRNKVGQVDRCRAFKVVRLADTSGRGLLVEERRGLKLVS